MAQQINLPVFATGITGIAIEGGLSGLGNKVMQAKSGGDGLEFSGDISVPTLNASSSLTVQGAGPFNSLTVDGNSLTSVVDSTFTANVILPNLAGGSERAIVISTGGELGSDTFEGTGNILRSTAITNGSEDWVTSGSISSDSLGTNEITVAGDGPFASLTIDGSNFEVQVPSNMTAGLSVSNGLTVDSIDATSVGTTTISVDTIAFNKSDTFATLSYDGSAISTAQSLNIGGSSTINNLTVTHSGNIGDIGGGDYLISVDPTFQQVGFFGADPIAQQSVTETSADPAITEIQNILIAYGLAADGR